MVHGRITGKHELTRLITALIWGNPKPKLGVPKLPKLELLQLWRPIMFCANLWFKWGLKQSCSPCQDLSNYMWHPTYKQVNQGDSWLLVVKSQIDNLIPNLSFGHNLCFKYPNGLCKPILDIYISRNFQ